MLSRTNSMIDDDSVFHRYRDEEPLIKSKDEFYKKDNSRKIGKFPLLPIYSLSFLLLQTLD